MLRTLTPLLATAALLTAAPRLPADDGPTAVIARAIKAHGGEETLAKHQAAQIRTKGKITIAGIGEIDFSQQVSYMLPDKFKDELEMSIAGQKVAVTTWANGDTVAIEANGKAVEANDRVKTVLKDARHMVKIGRLVGLIQDKKYEFASVGESKVDDRPVVGVRVTAKGQKDVNLFFEKKTGLLAKVELRTTDPMTGNEITEERIISEYQKGKDGLPVPKRVVVKHDGKTFVDAEVIEMTYLEKLDETEFKK